MVEKNTSDFLDEEKLVFNYFKKIKKLILLIQKINKKKSALVKKLEKDVDLLKEIDGKNALVRWFSKKDNKKRVTIAARVTKRKKSFRRLLHHQARLVGKENEFINKEELSTEDLAKGIESISLFANINQDERNAIFGYIKKNSWSVKRLLEYINGVVRGISDNQKLLEEIHETQRPAVPETSNPSHALNHAVSYEQYALNNILHSIESIMEVSQEVMKEVSEIRRTRESLNPKDVELAMQELHKDIAYEKTKLERIKDILHKQRAIRKQVDAKQLIAVHLTDYFPKNGKIITVSFSGKMSIKDDFFYTRETIHFSLNGAVTGNSGGDWTGKKYAILIPFDKIFDRVIVMASMDSFVLGNLELPPGTDIIVPEPKNSLFKKAWRRHFEKQARNAHIIMRQRNENISEVVASRIRERGYTPMQVGAWGWAGPFSGQDFDDLCSFGVSLFCTSDDNPLDKRPSIDIMLKNSFAAFAKAAEKKCAPHTATFWNSLEEITGLAHSALVKGDSKENILFVQQEILEMRRELGRRAKKLHSKEEKAAMQRIIAVIRALYKGLEAKKSA